MLYFPDGPFVFSPKENAGTFIACRHAHVHVCMCVWERTPCTGFKCTLRLLALGALFPLHEKSSHAFFHEFNPALPGDSARPPSHPEASFWSATLPTLDPAICHFFLYDLRVLDILLPQYTLTRISAAPLPPPITWEFNEVKCLLLSDSIRFCSWANNRGKTYLRNEWTLKTECCLPCSKFYYSITLVIKY